MRKHRRTPTLTTLAVASGLALAAAFGLAPATGCGESPAGSPDAADGDDADWTFPYDAELPPAPTPPAPPVLTPCPAGWVEIPPDEPDGVAVCDPWPDGGPAVLTPCPEGWREVEDATTGTVACDPWPEGGALDCADDEAHFPGEIGCSRIGTACTDDPWAADLPSDRPIRYVLAGAPAGGDGTRSSPFGTIASALAGASSGTVVAVSKGTFDEAVILPAGVTLWGACVAETFLAASISSNTTGTVSSGGRDPTVRNLRVGGDRPGVTVGARRSLHLEDVLIAGTPLAGCRALGDGATVTGRTVVVRDTRDRDAAYPFGNALETIDGGRIEITRGVFQRALDVAVFAAGTDTAVVLQDVAVVDTVHRTTGRQNGLGLLAVEGARVSAGRSVFERNLDAAIAAQHAGTEVALTDVVIRDTLPCAADDGGGRAIHAEQGALVEGTRVLIERNRDVAVAVFHGGTVVRLVDSVVRDTLSLHRDSSSGKGVAARAGARVELRRVDLARNREVALLATDAGSVMVVEDSAIRDTRSRESDALLGQAVSLQAGARIEIARVLLAGNAEAALAAFGADTTLVAEDIVIRDTRGRDADGRLGRAVAAQQGPHMEISRALFERNREIAVALLHAGTTLTLTDAVLRDTECQESDHALGRAMHLWLGPSAVVRRAIFERSREIALVAGGPGTRLSLEDVVVRDTLPLETDGRFGTAVGAYFGGALAAVRFSFENSAMCGVQLAFGQDELGLPYPQGGTMDLEDGIVAGNVVCGANVQTPGFDLRRLERGVRWRDNGLDLDMTHLPVPSPVIDP